MFIGHALTLDSTRRLYPFMTQLKFISTSMEKRLVKAIVRRIKHDLGRDADFTINSYIKNLRKISFASLGTDGAQALSSTLPALVGLEEFDVSGDFSTSGWSKMFVGLKELPLLKSLKIHGKFFDWEPPGFSEFLRKSSTLEQLSISGQTIGCVVMNSLLENTSLVCLKNLEMNSTSWEILANSLYKNKTLTYLDVDYNSLDGSSEKKLAQALQNNCSLKTLKINNFRGGNFIAQCISVNSTLTKLKFHVGTVSTAILAKSLAKNSSLKKLTVSSSSEMLRENFANPDMIWYSALAVNRSITKLVIKSQFLSVPLAKSLAESLRKNSTITSLNMSYTSIAAESADLFNEFFQENNSLIELDIRRCFIEYSLLNKALQIIFNYQDSDSSQPANPSHLSTILKSIKIMGLSNEKTWTILAQTLQKNTVLTNLEIADFGTRILIFFRLLAI